MKNVNQRCYKCLKPFNAKEVKMHGLHAPCFRAWFQVPENTDFQDLALKPQDKASHYPLENPMISHITSSFFQGKYKKYACTLNNMDYILKVQQSECPELPATEYLCNQIASVLKIPVPKYYFLQFENSLETFVVKNFMNGIEGGNLIHIYHYLSSAEEFNCEKLIQIISDKTGRKGDVSQFIRMCLFDALIGNHDRHGRNFGFIQTANQLVLAPIYDNPSYLAIEDAALLGADHEPRGKIATSTTINPSMKDYIIEFKRLGFKDWIIYFTREIKISKILSLIEDSFISDIRKAALQRLILKRFQEMRYD